MKSSAVILIKKNNTREIFIDGQLLPQAVAIGDISGMYDENSMKEIDITLCVSDVAIIRE